MPYKDPKSPEAVASNEAKSRRWREANPEKVKAANKAWRQANPDKDAARKKAWNAKNRERVNASMRAWIAAHPERKKEINRKSQLKRDYDITVEEYDVRFAKQEGLCKICSSPPIGRRLDIDHCHSTGKVRGLLCTDCNTSLGKFKDSPELLEKAAAYVRACGNI